MCDCTLRNEDAFAHVEHCQGVVGSIAMAGSSAAHLAETTADGEPETQTICCPACDVVCNGLTDLNKHLDGGCAPPRVAPATAAADANASALPNASAATPAAAASLVGAEKLDLLAQELRCPLCFDFYDDPHSLPCQHSFCKGCLDQCFKVTATMACPLCKAPMWRRQVAPNRTLADIVRTFRSIAEPEEGANMSQLGCAAR